LIGGMASRRRIFLKFNKEPSQRFIKKTVGVEGVRRDAGQRARKIERRRLRGLSIWGNAEDNN